MGSNLVSLARDLQRRKARRRRRLTLAEGARLVAEALESGLAIRGVLVTSAFEGGPQGAPLLESLAAHSLPVEIVPNREMARLADTETPQGVLAIVELPRWTLDDLRLDGRETVIVLDGVQDPGNVGTLLRTAYALGAAGAILLKGTADLANPKVLRGAMGATFRLPGVPATDDELASWARARDVELWAAAPQGTRLDRAQAPPRVALVVGNEGAGIRPAVQGVCRRTVSIPLMRGAESLNVAVAAGILLYELQHAGR